jgi:hypothetical protein
MKTKSLMFLFSSLFTGLSVSAQVIQPGEGYVTRFSGVVHKEQGKNVIDPNGTVGSIIDLRYPKRPPDGSHWIDEPQRVPIKASEAGQVFAIAIDNNSGDIYVGATAKFGLHLNDDKSWMEGMWGKNGDAGTVYLLQADNDYQPQIFTHVTLNGRKNTGASLGDVVYDANHKQIFVSDLETGMIHRYAGVSGEELGYFDHGVTGRSRFLDKDTGKHSALASVKFDINSAANIKNCEHKLEDTTSCWNLAKSGRRVWGLGLYSTKDDTRLYYAVWSGEDKNNSIWSVGLDQKGDFNLKDIQREFILPMKSSDNSLQISDIAFSIEGEMLIAENGELRNLGLDADEPFSRPFDSSLYIYTQNQKGLWTQLGRYNVGNLSKQTDEEQPQYNSSAGGTDFGYGYTDQYVIDLTKRDEFVWVTGDALCSPEGPCYEESTKTFSDSDEVHGLQGMPKSSYGDDNFIIPTYLIDTDINLLADGKKSPAEAQKNDATFIGDVEIAKKEATIPVPETSVVPIHNTQISGISPTHYRLESHNRLGSHQRQFSHYRSASHEILYSHHRFGSHHRLDSHYRLWSHDRVYSHQKYSSHTKYASHLKFGSHDRKASHLKWGSHDRKASHLKIGSHNRKASHLKIGSHDKKASHLKIGSHDKKASHLKIGSHDKKASHLKIGSHDKKASHLKIGSHDKKASHLKIGSHDKKASHLKIGSHDKKASHLKIGSHDKKASHLKIGSHDKKASHLKIGSHNKNESHLKWGSHDKRASHLKIGSHNKNESHLKWGSHDKRASHLKIGSHNKNESHLKWGSHDKNASHLKMGSHDKNASHLKWGSHDKQRSLLIQSQ